MKEIPIFTIDQFIVREAGNGVLKVQNGHYEKLSRKPEGLIKTDFQLFRLYTDRPCYITPRLKMYIENTAVILPNYKFLGYTKEGEPVMEIDGEVFAGYQEISKYIYGYWDPSIKPKLWHYLEDDFDPSKLKFHEWSNYMGRKYPVFKYGKQTIRGMKGLKNRFPKTPEKAFEVEIPQHKDRHEELIEEYNIKLLDKGYKATIRGIHYEYSSQNKLIDALKEQGESISTGTRRKLFASLRGEDL